MAARGAGLKESQRVIANTNSFQDDDGCWADGHSTWGDILKVSPTCVLNILLYAVLFLLTFALFRKRISRVRGSCRSHPDCRACTRRGNLVCLLISNVLTNEGFGSFASQEAIKPSKKTLPGRIAKRFSIPLLLRTRLCYESNGFAGSEPALDADGRLQQYST